MQMITRILKEWGLHSILLPLFFILHTYSLYYGLVGYKAAFHAFLTIAAWLIVVFILSWLFTRNANRSFLITTFLGILTLFFGDYKDLLERITPVLSKYSILLPVLVIVATLVIRLIVRMKDARKATLFLNLFFLFSVLSECVVMLNTTRSSLMQKNLMTSSNDISLTANAGSKPDVYYLLFDSYPSNNMLVTYMQYDNNPFEKSLMDSGFRVIPGSASNYNRTAFSMASSLNFQYLRNGVNFSPIGPKDYSSAMLTIEKSLVPRVFQSQGYEFNNLSIFSINGTRPPREENFLTMPEKTMLLYNTLPGRLKKDLLWNFTNGKYSNSFIRKLLDEETDRFNELEKGKKEVNATIYNSLLQTLSGKKTRPQFTYAHFYLPHPPFFFDESGNSIDMKVAVSGKILHDKKDFLAYLRYTNKIILDVVGKIKAASGNKAVIIVQSDHGFTDFEDRPPEIETVFQNFTAFYFPDRDYSLLYDSISNVNTFPVVFNKYFNASIELKKDTSIFLSY